MLQRVPTDPASCTNTALQQLLQLLWQVKKKFHPCCVINHVQLHQHHCGDYQLKAGVAPSYKKRYIMKLQLHNALLQGAGK